MLLLFSILIQHILCSTYCNKIRMFRNNNWTNGDLRTRYWRWWDNSMWMIILRQHKCHIVTYNTYLAKSFSSLKYSSSYVPPWRPVYVSLCKTPADIFDSLLLLRASIFNLELVLMSVFDAFSFSLSLLLKYVKCLPPLDYIIGIHMICSHSKKASYTDNCSFDLLVCPE